MILTLLAAMAATAQAPDAAPAKPKKEKKLCRSAVPTGSRMPVTTCHTAAEWVAIDQSNQNLGPAPFSQTTVQH